jgi:diguanylate cyclase (GGDEF)-like protein
MSGDQVIRALSHALMAGVRRIDIIGRDGGEEFGVILLDTPPAQAGMVIDGLRERFADIAFETDGRIWGAMAGTVGHSSGVFSPQRCKSPFIPSSPSCIGVGGKHADGRANRSRARRLPFITEPN